MNGNAKFSREKERNDHERKDPRKKEEKQEW